MRIPHPHAAPHVIPNPARGSLAQRGPAFPGADPLYLALTRTWDDADTTTSYLHTVASLAEDTKVDTRQARELPGPAKLYAFGKLRLAHASLYPDTTNSQLIRWNPTTMKVDKAIPLPETVRKGFLSYYGLNALVRGDKLLFSVGWFDAAASRKRSKSHQATPTS